MQISNSNQLNSAILGIYRLLIISFSLLVIYYAQTIVIPLTIAALLTFLLNPLVVKLEKWIGRVISILLVVIVVFSIIGLIGYIFAKQIISFGSNFQSYYEIIQKKIETFEFPHGGIFARIGNVIGKVKEELLGETNTQATSLVGAKLIDMSSSFLSFVESFFGSFLSVLGMTGIVLLLVIFMLLNREDIRGRIIKLIGQNRISSTTSAMNEASERVFNYITRFFFVNVCFGICVTTGLYFIGIPNAILWGCLGAILRFIPYIGPWIAASIPIALSFIITDSWIVPIITISFFIVLEMITAYAIEPFYYGWGTGVSSFALVVAAIFWTWIWGPIGLLLSTPLTVCLVVLGQYVTNMSFLNVLLSHEQALTPAEECYHRLLSFNSSESMDVVETYLQKNSLVSLFDNLLIPVLAQTERDFYLEQIDIEQKEEVYQSVREIVDYLDINEQIELNSEQEKKGKIYCLPAQTIRDEIGVNIMSKLLESEFYDVNSSKKSDLKDLFKLIEKENLNAVCIGVVAPFVFSKTRYLCAGIHQRKPELPIIVSLLGFQEISSQIIEKLSSAGATKVVLSLSQLVDMLEGFSHSRPISTPEERPLK